MSKFFFLNVYFKKIKWEKAPGKQNLFVNFNTYTPETSSRNQPASSELSLA